MHVSKMEVMLCPDGKVPTDHQRPPEVQLNMQKQKSLFKLGLEPFNLSSTVEGTEPVQALAIYHD